LNDYSVITTIENKNTTLPLHRRCACHLLILISKKDIDKIQDFIFEQLRSTVFEKLQKLWNKQSSSSLSSDIIMRHLGKPFVVKYAIRVGIPNALQ
jgi:trehalose utilization protein